MKPKFSLAIGALVCSLIGVQTVNAQSVSTIEEYNKQLPYWGVSWKPGTGATNGYYPSFYTGFAMRQQSPEKIHIRLSRGNNTRMSVILDEATINDYLFDLVKRADVTKKLASTGVININPSGGAMIPQSTYFNNIVDSPAYGIRAFVNEAKSGKQSAEQIYAKSLEVLTKLNPGRIFMLKIDLNAEFKKFKAVLNAANVSSEQGALTALDQILWGRINLTSKPSAEVLAKLSNVAQLAGQGDDAKFNAAALDLFKAVTGSKYQIKVLENGRFVDAIQCANGQCTLSYPEFTAIYPTGTAMASMTDQFGNKINRYATPGLWPFIERSGGRGVDNIRDEPYYGWIPKMDYQEEGNGFHNPAVRMGLTSSQKNQLGIPASHSTLWAVKRGDVSHGCSRMPVGHVWEMRQILPVEDSKMVQVYYFGNDSRDFDAYDVDGDGKLEVMGVEYTISYGLQANTGLSSREGTGLELSEDRKLEFYTKLYGRNNVFSVGNNQQIFFKNPGVSIQSYLDLKKVGVKSRLVIQGDVPLYEQTYEKDKVQFYSSGGVNKKLHRVMGRIKGCAPTSDKVKCGEAASDSQVQAFVR